MNPRSRTVVGSTRSGRAVMVHVLRRSVLAWGLLAFSVVGACQTSDGGRTAKPGLFGLRWGQARSDSKTPRIRRVICLYERKPWLNLDAAGDRDPEGIRYRVFLDAGAGKGVLADGNFKIEMYGLKRNAEGNLDRTLVSDWHYPTSRVHTIAKPGMLGEGYFLYLRWASKDIAGMEIELITTFEDAAGNTARSATKRFRIPKYRT